MRRDDLAVQVFLGGAGLHARSIETRLSAFNAAAQVALLIVGLTGSAAAMEVPGSDGRLELGGYVDGLAVGDTADGPRQRPQGALSLKLDARPADWLRGRLEIRSQVGGPFEGAHAGIYDLVHTYQNHSPALEIREAYVDALFARADLRVGVQTVTWGALDGVPPTDVVSPRDYHDPIVGDSEERKLGIPAISGSYALPDLPRLTLAGMRATLVYVPIATPPRLALAEERWFPPSILPGTSIVLPRRLVADALGPLLPPGTRVADDVRIPVSVRTRNRRPPKQLDAGGIGFRLGGTWREHNWNLYHYTGPETGPDVDLLSTVRLDDIDFPDGVLRLRLRAVSTLRQAHDVMHMVGGDWSRAMGPATLRAEVATFIDRPYLRFARDLFSGRGLQQLPLRRIARNLLQRGRSRVPLADLFIDRDTVEWGAGADVLVRSFQPLVQVNQIVGLDATPRLLVDDPETRFTASLRRAFLNERLELDLRGVYALERGGWYVLPRLVYRPRDDVRLRLGYLAIGGSRASLVGQFGENDEVIFEARYTF